MNRIVNIYEGGLRATFFVAACLALMVGIIGHKARAQNEDIRLMFYNVENLFDTINDPYKNDEDFTPEGKLLYTSDRFNQKLNHIALVIDSSFGEFAADAIGLCEVENEEVVKELVAKLDIKGYKIIHQESKDLRGIDNALIYNSKKMSLLESGFITVDLGVQERPTRDILWGVFEEKSTRQEIIILVNHWPSRYGGADESSWKRLKAAEALVTGLREIGERHKKALTVVMGDFNDHPEDESLKVLASCESGSPCLTNLFTRFEGSDEGTYVYKKQWGVLDQILVNQLALSGEAALETSIEHAGIVKYKWMLYESQDHNYYPSRTYGGSQYYGGYSDHLPVTLTFTRSR